VHATATHGSPGARECPQDSTDCILSMRHYMRASCTPDERAPPFVLQMPYSAGHRPDNLVVEVEDLNPADYRNSLHIALYASTGSHETLEGETPLLSTSTARKRIFSLGFSSIEMAQQVCGGTCSEAGQANFSLVVTCGPRPVAFRVIALFTPLELTPGVPVHGEVCPNNWIFHKLVVPDTDASHSAAGVAFTVHVHQGDVYYMMSRWDHTPGFAACNENSLAMTNRNDGVISLCHLAQRFAATSIPSRRLASADSSSAASTSNSNTLLSDAVARGYVGLYGGRSCAHYTIDSHFIPEGGNCTQSTCSNH